MAARLHPPPPGLDALVRACVLRDSRARPFAPGERRLNRYPALPLCSLNFTLAGKVLRQPFELGATPRPDSPDLVPLPAAFVAGPNTRPILTYDLAPVDSVTVAFHAPAFAWLTGHDPAGLVDRFLPAEAVFGAAAGELARTLAATPAPEARIEAVAAFLRARWRGDGYDPGTTRAGRLLARLTVGAAAALLNLGARTMERRFRRGFGLAPRSLRRSARAEAAFLAARDAARQGEAASLAELAAAHGYADQAHLAHDFRALAGTPPAELLARVDADDAYWTYRL